MPDDIKNDPRFTGWMFTDTTRFVDCPKCGQTAGNVCRTPKGRLTKGHIPHTERTAALVKQYGTVSWVRTTAISGADLIKRILGQV